MREKTFVKERKTSLFSSSVFCFIFPPLPMSEPLLTCSLAKWKMSLSSSIVMPIKVSFPHSRSKFPPPFWKLTNHWAPHGSLSSTFFLFYSTFWIGERGLVGVVLAFTWMVVSKMESKVFLQFFYDASRVTCRFPIRPFEFERELSCDPRMTSHALKTPTFLLLYFLSYYYYVFFELLNKRLSK